MPTLAEKLVAKAAGLAAVKPGDIVTCRVDLALIHDSGGPRRVKPILDRLGVGLWDPRRVVLVADHYLPATDDESRAIGKLTREFATAHGLRHFYDGLGICHVVVAEHGHVRPGMFAVGGDSHSPTGGAFGAYMFGIGATEMAGVLATGEIWLRTPDTIRIEWSGRLADGVVAKDIMLFLCARLGMDGGDYQAIEYAGDAVTALDMQERMTLSNMAAELGAQAGLIAPDATTAAYLRAAGVEVGDLSSWRSDDGAPTLAHHRFDGTALAPQVAAPHSPANAAPVGEHSNVAINTAYVGACTGAKLADLRAAARILRGKTVAPHVRLLVAPASACDLAAARADGTIAALEQAGATLLATSCGACAGYGSVFDDATVCISSTARNFKGRMGAPGARVYLGSPLTVAASAVAGRIADPREMLA